MSRLLGLLGVLVPWSISLALTACRPVVCTINADCPPGQGCAEGVCKVPTESGSSSSSSTSSSGSSSSSAAGSSSAGTSTSGAGTSTSGAGTSWSGAGSSATGSSSMGASSTSQPMSSSMLRGCGSAGSLVLREAWPAPMDGGVPTCSGNPCRARVQLVFNSEITSVQGDVEFMACPDPACSSGVAALAVTTSRRTVDSYCIGDTVEFDLSWIRFPENAILHWAPTAGFLVNGGPLTQFPDGGMKVLTQSAPEVYPVLDTGQTACFDGGGTAPCMYSGQDGDHVDTPHARTFVVADGGDPDDGGPRAVVMEPSSGLMWTRCLEGDRACNGNETRMQWPVTLQACSHLNVAGLANRHDWRLPTRRELERLVRLGSSAPFDPGLLPGVMTDANHAVASLQATNRGNRWALNQLGISGATAFTETSGLSVRCVSSQQATPSVPLFTSQDPEAEIRDEATGLVWTRCLDGETAARPGLCNGPANTVPWDVALDQCNTRTPAGTWRLPNAHELASLLALDAATAPTWNPVFPPSSSTSLLFWSSTTDELSGDAVVGDFLGGSMKRYPKETSMFYVRCVRNAP